MSQPVIGFFSSDATELYKVDVYRAVALPTGYVIHFRYERQYVHPELLTRLSKLNGSNGIIFFVAGNDPNKNPSERTLSWYSVRRVIVRDVQENPTIDTFHFYLELGDFIDATPHSGTNKSLLPPYAFISELSVDEGPNKHWLDRVKQLAPFFRGVAFFTIQDVSHRDTRVAPVYDRYARASQYPLEEEETYQCTITWYNPEGRETGLSATNTNPAVDLAIPANHRLAAERDTRVFDLQTHSLAQKRLVATSYINDRAAQFNGQAAADAWRVEIKWTISRGWRKAILFGVLSAAAALGLGLAKLATDDLRTASFDWHNVMVAAAALLFIGVAAGWLYDFFNKK
jgi:hypothetical protein